MPCCALVRDRVEEEAEGGITEARAALIGWWVERDDVFDLGEDGEDGGYDGGF